MKPQTAISQLEQAFTEKHRFQPLNADRVRIGIFGNRFPEVVLHAAGCHTTDVKAIPDVELDDHHPGIASLIEPFLDDYTQAFLHRLFTGRFSALQAILFCRQDASALVAYQYAQEYLRQGRCENPTVIPRLLLWNAEFGDTEAIHRFNLFQVRTLWQSLNDCGIAEPNEAALQQAFQLNAERQALLCKLDEKLTAARPLLSGSEALCWRQAGRYMTTEQHLESLQAALDELAHRPGQGGHRFGLYGSFTDDMNLYQLIDQHGALVCDQQPMAEGWPVPALGDSPSVDSLMQSIETDPLVSRGRSSLETLKALVARYKASECQTVILQLDDHDDTLGWDIPQLKQRLAESGINALHLGFRPLRPDAAWLADAGTHIQKAVEAFQP